MKKSMKKVISILLMVVILASAAISDATAIEVQAAKKVKTTVTENKYKKSPKVKTGTTTVTSKKRCFVKFKAPKTKTYTFTVSNVYNADDKSDPICGDFSIYKLEYGKIFNSQTVKTQGGKVCNANVASSTYLKDEDQSGVSSKNKYRPSRYAKIKLNKGETVYVRAFFTCDKCTYTLKVK